MREQGLTFVFKYDNDDYARHLTTIDDALDVYFDATATQAWNPASRRFERFNSTHGLFWFWLDEADQVVMVITCFSV